MITIDFEADTVYGKYRDAIVLPDDHTLTEAEIEQLKSTRVSNWVSFVAEASKSNNTIEVN